LLQQKREELFERNTGLKSKLYKRKKILQLRDKDRGKGARGEKKVDTIQGESDERRSRPHLPAR